MKHKFSAILWREINRDIKSYKALWGSLMMSFIAILYYKNYGQIADTFYYIAIGLLAISFSNSSYFMNNIITVLCLPIRMRDYCIGRTIYKIFRMCLWMIIFTAFMKVIYHIKIVPLIRMRSVNITLVLLTLTSIAYVFEYLILIMGKRYFSIMIMIGTYILAFFKYLLFSNNLRINILLIIIDFLMVLVVYRKSESIDLEYITRRWI